MQWRLRKKGDPNEGRPFRICMQYGNMSAFPFLGSAELVEDQQ